MDILRCIFLMGDLAKMEIVMLRVPAWREIRRITYCTSVGFLIWYFFFFFGSGIGGGESWPEDITLRATGRQLLFVRQKAHGVGQLRPDGCVQCLLRTAPQTVQVRRTCTVCRGQDNSLLCTST